MQLSGARIGGQVIVDQTVITNDSGPALHADDLRADRTIFLYRSTARGAGEKGAVRLLGVRSGDQMVVDQMEITNDSGPALLAHNLRTEHDLFLREATVYGTGEEGAVQLSGAHIGGQFGVVDTRLDNDSGPLMALDELRVDGLLVLPMTTVCRQALAGLDRQGCPDGSRQLEVRDLVFSRLGDVSWRQWLHLLVHHTPDYLPQPFQQLAAVERVAGHDGNARAVLVAQQDDLRRRDPDALGGRVGRWRHRAWGLLGRYGYRAHRLIIALFVVLTLASGTAYVAGQTPTRPGHHAAERVSPSLPGTPCSTAELLGLGIDRGLPLGATGLRARCDLDTATRRGQAFTYALWGFQALLWALTTLAIAAYTGLVRKPT
ncbi:hypothetical protein AB0H12_29680 [Actinosynnema sp. NPDC023794]